MKEAKKLAEDLRRSVKGPEWEVEKKSSSQIQFVADWPQLNRFVRIVYKDLGTHYAISLASARRAFLVPVFTESILVQDGLINKLQSSSTAHSAPPFPILELFKIPEAQAQNLTNWNSLLDQYLKNPNINKDVSKIKTDFGSGSTDVNHFINQFHNDGNGNFSLKTSADVAVSANLNANLNATANVGDSTLKAVDGTLNQNVAAPVNHLANSITGAGNQGLAAATKLGDSITSAANTLTSPKNALLMSLAGGIGFFGSQAILHFAADGTIRVIEGLYHNIMGTLTDSEKNKMTELFGKAFQDFDHSSAEMNDIEHSLDEQFAAMAIATNEDPESLAKRFNSKDKIDLLSDLDKQRLRANSSFRVAEKNLDEIGARQGMTCPNYENALNNLVGIDNQAKSLNFLYDSLKKVGGNYSLLCQNI